MASCLTWLRDFTPLCESSCIAQGITQSEEEPEIIHSSITRSPLFLQEALFRGLLYEARNLPTGRFVATECAWFGSEPWLFPRVCFGLQAGTPHFNGDDVSLPRKDFGQEHLLDFFVTIHTTIGEDGELIILISGFPQG